MTTAHDPCAMCANFTVPPPHRPHYLPKLAGSYLIEKGKQFLCFTFHVEIVLLKYDAVIDQLLVSFVNESLRPLSLAEVPGFEICIVRPDRQNESRCRAICANNLIPCNVIVDGTQPWQKRLINSEGGCGYWQEKKKRFSWKQRLEVGAKNILRSLECIGEVCPYQLEKPGKFIGIFLFLAPLLRFRLLPGHPDRHKNSPYRAYSLQPSRPVSAGQAVIPPCQKRKPCQRRSGIENEAGRAEYLAKFRCHFGILA